MKIDNIDYYWNHTNGGACLEIHRDFGVSLFFDFQDIITFLRELNEILKKKLSLEIELNEEFEIKLNNERTIYIQFDNSVIDKTYYIHMLFWWPQSLTTITMKYPELEEFRKVLGQF